MSPSPHCKGVPQRRPHAQICNVHVQVRGRRDNEDERSPDLILSRCSFPLVGCLLVEFCLVGFWRSCFWSMLGILALAPVNKLWYIVTLWVRTHWSATGWARCPTHPPHHACCPIAEPIQCIFNGWGHIPSNGVDVMGWPITLMALVAVQPITGESNGAAQKGILGSSHLVWDFLIYFTKISDVYEGTNIYIQSWHPKIFLNCCMGIIFPIQQHNTILSILQRYSDVGIWRKKSTSSLTTSKIN